MRITKLFFGKNDFEESSSSSSSSYSFPQPLKQEKGKKKEDRNNKQEKTKKSKKVCWGCGLPGHLRNECLFGYFTKDGKPDHAKTMNPD